MIHVMELPFKKKYWCQLHWNEWRVCQTKATDIFPVLIHSMKGIPGYQKHGFASSASCGAPAFFFSLWGSAFGRFLPNLRAFFFFISICVLHSVLCVRKRYVDISDCQISGVGLGIIKWGQDYKALTVLYWSLPLFFVQRGNSSAEALEVMSKNRTAVYPPFPSMFNPPPSCPVCPSHLCFIIIFF